MSQFEGYRTSINEEDYIIIKSKFKSKSKNIDFLKEAQWFQNYPYYTIFKVGDNEPIFCGMRYATKKSLSEFKDNLIFHSRVLFSEDIIPIIYNIIYFDLFDKSRPCRVTPFICNFFKTRFVKFLITPINKTVEGAYLSNDFIITKVKNNTASVFVNYYKNTRYQPNIVLKFMIHEFIEDEIDFDNLPENGYINYDMNQEQELRFGNQKNWWKTPKIVDDAKQLLQEVMPIN